MDSLTARKLSKLTSSFYSIHAESFSNTRQQPWNGWTKVADLIAPRVERAIKGGLPFRVLDLGCGNLRFEAMLEEAFPQASFDFYAIDNCAPLSNTHRMPLRGDVHFQQLDIIESIESETLGNDLNAPACDLTVAFGIMHHIPFSSWRQELLRTLLTYTKQDGMTAITLWQFAKDKKARVKAVDFTEEGCRKLGITLNTEDGDYLLGWQHSPDAYRYCHSFSDSEIELITNDLSSNGSTVVAEFSDDGPTKEANRYLLLGSPRGDIT